MSTLSAGKDVLAYCNKCKLKLAHIIVVMNDPTTPGKVTCKTCRSTHAFKESAARRKTTISKLTKKQKKKHLRQISGKSSSHPQPPKQLNTPQKRHSQRVITSNIQSLV